MIQKQIDSIQKNGGVEVMKASAGSGKTFSLAREYIRLLLTPQEGAGMPDPKAYKHILAVTFTNKATGEMKARIITELNTLATDCASSGYRSYLMEKCGIGSESELSRYAGNALCAILNDYSAFSVSTIDSFFQTTLRAFSREIGQFAEYQIELDKESLVTEASARVLDSLEDSDDSLRKWLSNASIEQIEEGNGYHLDSIVEEFAKGYMSDAYAEKARKANIDQDKVFSEDNLKKLRKRCKDIISSYDEGLKSATAEAFRLAGLYPDIKAAVLSALAKFSSPDSRKPVEFSSIKALTDGAEDASTCFKVADRKKHSQADFDTLQEALGKVLSFSGEQLRQRNTAVMLSGQIYIFRMADSLRKEFETLLKEKNVLSLDDTNAILSGIIGGTEAPFIYEKTGIRYQHFLLDEFQDTARVQWDNFLPLLRNSISEGCYNLVVGDVKQSIYRWRNTDWKILDEQVSSSLDSVVEHPLADNWRSARNIVEFNNSLFSTLAERMDSQLDRRLPDGSLDTKISRIYSDVRQRVTPKIQVPGCVEASFCESGLLVDSCVEAVRDALARGFSKKDIAVIVRANSQGSTISQALLDAGIDVVTNDSLLISSGARVRRLVAQLYRYNNPDDKIHTLAAGIFDAESLKKASSLTDMAEELLRQMPPEDDSLYILAFLDLIRDFVQRNGNSLDAFLKYWEEEGVRRNVSSPEGSDAVTVITIHKVKGLDYPFVVLPFQAKNSFMLTTAKYWEKPEESEGMFEGLSNALYHVSLSGKSKDTLFYNNFLEEQQMAFIDNANLWYVAMTRASQAMHIIAPAPADRYRNGWTEFSQMSDALYMYIRQDGSGFIADDPILNGEKCEHFVLGPKSPKWVKEEKDEKKKVVNTLDMVYESGQTGIRGSRLRISSDSREFFSADGQTGISASNRLKGTMLHKIMEKVIREEDLHREVMDILSSGDMDSAQAAEAEQLLAGAIASVRDRGWFSIGDGRRIFCERDILEPTGESHRPDRVVISPDRVDIIDYKFGKEEGSYSGQVKGYADLYARMGYKNIHAYLWYIGQQTRVEEILL
ncbi:MAG: UvrD-helicase domain-containing protein [Bacteroidales bacterium]|nr:UvrD-helicase domain-containing protein [Candidatus Cryptobacteroides equifaecalis]